MRSSICSRLAWSSALLAGTASAFAGVSLDRVYYENTASISYLTSSGFKTDSLPADPSGAADPSWKELNPVKASDALGFDYGQALTSGDGTFTAVAQGRLNVGITGTSTNVTQILASYGTGSTSVPNVTITKPDTTINPGVIADRYAFIGGGGALGGGSERQFSFTVGPDPVKFSYSVNLYGANDDTGFNVNRLSLTNVNATDAATANVIDIQSATDGVVAGSGLTLLPGTYNLQYVSTAHAELMGLAAGNVASVPAGLEMTLNFESAVTPPPPTDPRTLITNWVKSAAQRLLAATSAAERRAIRKELVAELRDIIQQIRDNRSLNTLQVAGLLAGTGWSLAQSIPAASDSSTVVAGSTLAPEPGSLLMAGSVAALALRRRRR
ncbi:MAG: hypothetical protein QM770_22215 [Tepidisphaeraceae bacterium]